MKLVGGVEKKVGKDYWLSTRASCRQVTLVKPAQFGSIERSRSSRLLDLFSGVLAKLKAMPHWKDQYHLPGIGQGLLPPQPCSHTYNRQEKANFQT
jgi:hypothetical protein